MEKLYIIDCPRDASVSLEKMDNYYIVQRSEFGYIVSSTIPSAPIYNTMVLRVNWALSQWRDTREISFHNSVCFWGDMHWRAQHRARRNSTGVCVRFGLYFCQ